MKLSVIVVSYNSARFLPACLQSLRAHLGGVDHEVCVVDNASEDESRSVIHGRFPEVRLVTNVQNRGFSGGINIGLRQTTGRYVLWLNPDTELMNDGMSRLLEIFDEEPRIGVIGPRVSDPDGGLQPSCRSFPSYSAAIFNRQALMTRLFPKNRFSRDYLMTGADHSRRLDVDWISGACFLHRREVSDKLGGVDERFFMYCEDVDFCLRARRAGWSVIFHPALEVKHHIGGTTRQTPFRMIREHHRSMWRYYAKHYGRNALKDAAVGAGIAARLTLKAAGVALSSAPATPLKSP